MAARNIELSVGELYHIYNRGVDKRAIVLDAQDKNRFLQYFSECNGAKPIGSIYENSFRRTKKNAQELVTIVCYALNPNHFHLVLRPEIELGIEKFMHRLGTGFSKYFNHRYRRSGSLFQGKFQSLHIDSNEYLLRVSAYVNLNDQVHQLGRHASKLVATSWLEYLNPNQNSSRLSNPNIVLGQFSSPLEYREFAEEALTDIRNNKGLKIELEKDGNLDAWRPS